MSVNFFSLWQMTDLTFNIHKTALKIRARKVPPKEKRLQRLYCKVWSTGNEKKVS